MEFKNKTLLITGGTGSFGSMMLQHFIGTDIAEIRIFSRDEKKQEDLRIALQDSKINFVIGDVRNYKSIENAMRGVDYVFHAAALKQVPSCEFYPLQAIQTNILGAENVLEAAAINKVKRVVVLSTDKAVYPINTMGMSKALMEKLT
ncbi:MAG: polysaccharide biosynthesis protein, partial [Ignavibacteriaceae bacterium]